MNLTLADFDKTQKDLKKYSFTSEFIKFLDLTFNYVYEFESREKLSIKRKIKGKGKDSKLVICVEQEWACKDENGLAENFSGGGDVEFETEEQAIDFFLSQVQEAEFFIEKNRDNILWDGRRYFFKKDKDGNFQRVVI